MFFIFHVCFGEMFEGLGEMLKGVACVRACVSRRVPVQTVIRARDADADGWSLKGASAPRNQPNAPRRDAPR